MVIFWFIKFNIGLILVGRGEKRQLSKEIESYFILTTSLTIVCIRAMQLGALQMQTTYPTSGQGLSLIHI